LSADTPFPELTGRLLYIGQNTRQPEQYTVLSTQDFPVELKAGGSSLTELEKFTTSYDSDNKGTGNVGGFQYSGYLMVFLNDNKEVVYHQTMDAGIRKAIAANPRLPALMAGYKKGKSLSQKMTEE
jgi:choline dehydrogenase-like flavoprotein